MTIDLTAEEQTARDALQAEMDRLEEAHANADELPDDVDRRLAELESALAECDRRPLRFDPAEIAQAGAFASIDGSGGLRIERGFVRPEDEAPIRRRRRKPKATPISPSNRPGRFTTIPRATARHPSVLSRPKRRRRTRA